MFRRTHVAYTLFNGDVCNKKWSLDSAVQFNQQSNKSNNGFTCTAGSECNMSPLVSFTGLVTFCIVVMLMVLQSYNVNHFYDDYDTSNNQTIRAPNELVVVGDDTTSQAKSNGAMCITGAISAICLVFMAHLIRSMHAIGLR